MRRPVGSSCVGQRLRQHVLDTPVLAKKFDNHFFPSAMRKILPFPAAASSCRKLSSNREALPLSSKELRDFKDRLKALGPGKVKLSLDESTGLATILVDNHDRRNGEKHLVVLRVYVCVRYLGGVL